MKKYSISLLSILAAIIITLGSSSCSRKVGCYWSLTPETGSWNINSPASMPDLFPSENMSANTPVNSVEMTTNCE